MKRGRTGETFSGGTGDVSPQFLTLGINTQSAANTYTEIVQAIPIPRFTLAKGKSIVMELLKVYFDPAPWDANPAAGGSIGQSNGQLATISQTGFNPSGPQNLAYYSRNWRGAFTAAGTYEAVSDDPYVFDCTDGGGHGVLVATDNIFFGVNTVGFTAAGTHTCKVLYRFKQVTLQEYIGIVQGQQ